MRPVVFVLFVFGRGCFLLFLEGGGGVGFF